MIDVHYHSVPLCLLPGRSVMLLRTRFVVVALLLLVLAALLLAPDLVYGQTDLKNKFIAVHSRIATISVWIRNILFLVAGIALIACAASAYAGRFNIKWFVTVLVSVILIAVNGALTNYFVDTESGAAGSATTTPGRMNDALQGAVTP